MTTDDRRTTSLALVCLLAAWAALVWLAYRETCVEKPPSGVLSADRQGVSIS